MPQSTSSIEAQVIAAISTGADEDASSDRMTGLATAQDELLTRSGSYLAQAQEPEATSSTQVSA